MLDSSLKEQLTSVFAKLEKPVELVYEPSVHDDQKDLIEMLQDVGSTSANIKVRENAGGASPMPQFHIAYEGKPVGIVFKGIPGGHEFTSLILAILNTDGKGKLMDEMLANRVKRIKKNITVQTYMSLTCENCPEVVQAMNQITLAHGSMRHEVIDGGYVQDDIQKIGIQGVPSLVANNKMFHSGRISVLDLIAKLESTYGIDETQEVSSTPVNKNLGHFDALVIGGGPAGASAAIYTVRKGLSTAMITEKIGGQVQETKGIENLIGVTYTEGPALAAQLNQHVASYPVKVFENRRVKKVLTEGPSKTIELESGEYMTADSIIVTTGAKWRELNVEGEKEYMGRGVAYCPHCDGPFYKGKKVAVIGGGNSGVEAAIDLAGIVREVVVVEYNDQLKADRILVDKLKSLPNVSIITNAKTEKIIGDGQKVYQMEYTDRGLNKLEKLDLDGVFVQIGLVPNSQFLKDTVNLTKFGEIITDEKCRTNVKGIYAAGDVTTTPYKQIVIAMGEGAKAALAAFEDRMYAGANH
ncbi:MAG: alkyl hydroperoxide reductase subunit F [Bdellovibrio sp.]|nr:alkyl hydroperoxide reductase subunit F [Bdellovibrio sp.]